VGGVQIVRPAHTQATAAENLDIPGTPLVGAWTAPLGGAAIEGNMLVSAPSLDINGYALNSSGTFSTLKTYFADDGNAPPYFIGFHYIYDCLQLSTPSDYTYGCASAAYRALGLAEYLDADNWAQPQNGVGPSAVYAAMALHYQTYADLAAYLPSAFGAGKIDPKGTQPQDLCYQRIQSWDVTLGSTSSNNPTTNPLNPFASTPAC
jgi:hypothetical protein